MINLNRTLMAIIAFLLSNFVTGTYGYYRGRHVANLACKANDDEKIIATQNKTISQQKSDILYSQQQAQQSESRVADLINKNADSERGLQNATQYIATHAAIINKSAVITDTFVRVLQAGFSTYSAGTMSDYSSSSSAIHNSDESSASVVLLYAKGLQEHDRVATDSYNSCRIELINTINDYNDYVKKLNNGTNSYN